MINKEIIEKRLREEGPKKFRYTYEVVKGSGIFTNGRMEINYNNLFKKLGFDPVNFKDKRVLEIGASDGALAFYLEDMGANVTAIDVQEPTFSGFALVQTMRNSTVDHKIMSVYDLNKEFMGTFDYITFFGVFYHMKHPILAFERINGVSQENTLLFCGGQLGDGFFYNKDTQMQDGCNLQYITKESCPAAFSGELETVNDLPYAAFVETSFLKDTSNWFLPNRRCVEAWLKRTGFELIKSLTGISKISENPGKSLSPADPIAATEIMTRVSGHFCASYVGSAEPEFGFSPYKASNYIPTRIELEERDKRIKELEREIEQLKKSNK
ncbi:MAG: methyltransferase domain-containing protein [Candidatus Aminicenantes bacterium]|nr:methyltransferase domain-containing protein [Candidatus Aminicenantes bacterium]